MSKIGISASFGDLYCFINHLTTLEQQVKIKQNTSTHMNLYREAYHFCKEKFLIFLSQTAQHYSKILPVYEDGHFSPEERKNTNSIRAFISSSHQLSLILLTGLFTHTYVKHLGSRALFATKLSRSKTLFCSRCGVHIVGKPLGCLETTSFGMFSFELLFVLSSLLLWASIFRITCIAEVFIGISS